MSYVYYNPNPLNLSVGDCTIRAISCALNISWEQTYNLLARQGFQMCDMPSSNRVWGQLYENSMYSMARGGRGYSMTGSKEEVMKELQKMMNETHDEKVRLALTEALGKMNK